MGTTDGESRMGSRIGLRHCLIYLSSFPMLYSMTRKILLFYMARTIFSKSTKKWINTTNSTQRTSLKWKEGSSKWFTRTAATFSTSWPKQQQTPRQRSSSAKIFLLWMFQLSNAFSRLLNTCLTPSHQHFIVIRQVKYTTTKCSYVRGKPKET